MPSLRRPGASLVNSRIVDADHVCLCIDSAL